MAADQNITVPRNDEESKIRNPEEKGASVSELENGSIPTEHDDDEITAKTWAVVLVLALSYGISNWPLPCFGTITVQISQILGNQNDGGWIISTYTVAIAISFMICGANSDLLGRRWFIIGGNVILFVGFIVGATAKDTKALIASMALLGFGAGNAQLAAFAIPELLPNRWRHIGVVIADSVLLSNVVVGPVAGRFAIEHGDAWRWLLYGPAILTCVSFGLLTWLYFPPKHPRGLPWAQAVRELDYIGAILFTVATTLILAGIVYSSIIPASSPKVIVTLVVGFAVMVGFALYETFMPLKQPLTPTRVFTRDHGRELTAPFVAAFVATMYYYALNLLYPTIINELFLTNPSDYRYAIVLALPQNLGVPLGAILLAFFGSRIGHWRYTLAGSIGIAVLFGALLVLATPARKGMMIAFIFIAETGFGWAQYLTITFVQFGVDQVELGIAGGLAGTARYAGGAVALTVYSTILSNSQKSRAEKLVPGAAIAAGLPASSVPPLLAALPLGSKAVMAVAGVTPKIAAAAAAAWQQSWIHGIEITALASLGFGCVGVIACFCCNDIGKKMNNKIEVFLENDKNAAKNQFH